MLSAMRPCTLCFWTSSLFITSNLRNLIPKLLWKNYTFIEPFVKLSVKASSEKYDKRPTLSGFLNSYIPACLKIALPTN